MSRIEIFNGFCGSGIHVLAAAEKNCSLRAYEPYFYILILGYGLQTGKNTVGRSFVLVIQGSPVLSNVRGFPVKIGAVDRLQMSLHQYRSKKRDREKSYKTKEQTEDDKLYIKRFFHRFLTSNL